MIDQHIWPTLEEGFTVPQIKEMKELLEDAESLGGRDLDIVPQTLFDNKFCSICATFYSREVAELWVGRSGKKGKGKPVEGETAKGFRICIDFNVAIDSCFWPGW